MSNFLSALQDYDLYLNALLASLLISFAAAPIGVFLNLKRMTLMGEAISHSLLPGFALAFMFYGMSYSGLIVGGLFAGLLVLGLMMGLNRFVTIKEDGVLTIVYLTFSALGILIVLKSGIKIDLSHILIGNILLIDQIWLLILFVSSIMIRFIFSRIRRDLLIVLMDPEYAQFLNIPVQKVKSVFYFLVLWILVLCFYSVGTLLALGLLMIPALLAKVSVKSIDRQIHFSLFFGIIMSILGLAASIQLDWPTGPTIILSGGILFIVTILVKSGAAKAMIALVMFFSFHPSANAAFITQLQPKDQVLLSNSYLKLFLNHLVTVEDNFTVQTLVPIDQSVHNYQLKPSDLKKIKRTKVFLYIGNGVEDGLKDQVAQLNPEAKIVNLAAEIKLDSRHNEHFWLNPESAQPILDALKEIIVAEQPDLKDRVLNRHIQARFQILDYTTNVRDRFRPYKGQKVLISHNSLYFLNPLIGIQAHYYTQSTSPSEVVELRKILKDKSVPILKEYGTINFLFDGLVKDNQREYSGEVYGESIPTEIYESKNYLDLLKVNLDTIFEILAKNKIPVVSNRQMLSPAR